MWDCADASFACITEAKKSIDRYERTDYRLNLTLGFLFTARAHSTRTLQPHCQSRCGIGRISGLREGGVQVISVEPRCLLSACATGDSSTFSVTILSLLLT